MARSSEQTLQPPHDDPRVEWLGHEVRGAELERADRHLVGVLAREDNEAWSEPRLHVLCVFEQLKAGAQRQLCVRHDDVWSVQVDQTASFLAVPGQQDLPPSDREFMAQDLAHDVHDDNAGWTTRRRGNGVF
jgi:hypothetical protein